jgi:hypothetical protein
MTSPWRWRRDVPLSGPVWTRTWREGEMPDERVGARERDETPEGNANGLGTPSGSFDLPQVTAITVTERIG